MASEPKTLQEAILYFADFENCKAFMVSLRWPDAVSCPRCGATKVTWLAKTRVWKCYAKHEAGQGQTFTLKTGTIFEDSALPLEKWLPAVWLLVTCKNGISSYEISRDLGVSQKSAWHMMHRIRFALHHGSFDKTLSGHVEADETFIGGKARNMHVAQRQRRITGTGGKDKTPVLGIMERGGKVRTIVIPNRKKKALQAQVREHVEAGSALYTDALMSYHGLASDYAHTVVDHAVESVTDNVTHTNSLENYWALLKRTISGTYVSVEPFHLFRYLDEQAYRFNNRKTEDQNMNDFDRFKLAMTQVVGKRLTWDVLTGKTEEGPTQVN
jgi:transposase-like protein